MNNTSPDKPIHLTNGRIFGGDDGPPVYYNEVLIRNGLIGEVGDKIHDAPSDAAKIDLEDALVLPGLCDAHLHMAAGGQSLGITDLSELNQLQVQSAIRSAVERTEPGGGEWLQAFNWDENDSCRLNADILERLAPGLPLLVHKRDLHGCCCNRTALNLAGISSQSSAPEGGAIGRTPDGSPNGMLYESAIGLVSSVRPKPDEATRRRFILRAQNYLVTTGLTGVSEVLDLGNEAIYRSLDDSGQLQIDVDGWRRIEHWDGASKPVLGNRFRVGTLKLFLDGSFGSRTAAMDEPFSNGAESGQLLYGDDELRNLFGKARDFGWRLAIHAIGDKAVRQACYILAEFGPSNDVFARIEHLQQFPPGGVDLVKRSGAVASLQPVHLLDDQQWLPGLIGLERCRNSFLWKSLCEEGITIASGSDWPVASPDPLIGLHAAVNRAKFGEQPNSRFARVEALEPWQAIRAATRGYAVATSRISERGSITAGKFADLTVIDDFDPHLRDWSSASIRMTISRGKIIHSK